MTHVCAHRYMYVHSCLCVQVPLSECMIMHMNMCIYICEFVCMDAVHVCVHIYVCASMYVCVCLCTYMYIYVCPQGCFSDWRWGEQWQYSCANAELATASFSSQIALCLYFPRPLTCPNTKILQQKTGSSGCQGLGGAGELGKE